MARTKNPGLARVRPREDGDVDRLERGHASYRRRPRHDRVEPSIEPSAEPSTSVTVPEASVEVEQPDPPVPVDHQAEVDPQPEHAEAEQPEREPLELQTVPPFPGGPDDLSLLHDYAQHIAPWTWHSLLGTTHEAYVDRGDLTCATVGSKLEKMTCEGDSEAFDEVRTRVIASGLYPLVRASYTMTDKGLVSALVERWHSETSSFHMPFGEMTVTLDDVSALLHIPMDERFYTHGLASRHEAAETCVMLLGGQSSDYTREFDAVNTLGLRFGFLQQRYTTTLAAGEYDYAARCYLIHLVGATLFANKSGGYYAGIYWIGMLEDLTRVSEYAWGPMALATLYDELAQASRHTTMQMGGYTSLLLAWAFEHFPSTMIYRVENPVYTEDP